MQGECVCTYKEQNGSDSAPHDPPPHGRLAADHHLDVLEEVVESVDVAEHEALEEPDDEQRVGRGEVVDDLDHVDASLKVIKVQLRFCDSDSNSASKSK